MDVGDWFKYIDWADRGDTHLSFECSIYEFLILVQLIDSTR